MFYLSIFDVFVILQDGSNWEWIRSLQKNFLRKPLMFCKVKRKYFFEKKKF